MPGPQAAHEYSVIKNSTCKIQNASRRGRETFFNALYSRPTSESAAHSRSRFELSVFESCILNFELPHTPHRVRRPRLHFSRCGNPPLLDRTGLRTDLARRAARGGS